MCNCGNCGNCLPCNQEPIINQNTCVGVKLPDLDYLLNISNNDLLYIYDTSNNVSKKISINQLVNFINTQVNNNILPKTFIYENRNTMTIPYTLPMKEKFGNNPIVYFHQDTTNEQIPVQVIFDDIYNINLITVNTISIDSGIVIIK